jgi:hypothetical protein
VCVCVCVCVCVMHMYVCGMCVECVCEYVCGVCRYVCVCVYECVWCVYVYGVCEQGWVRPSCPGCIPSPSPVCSSCPAPPGLCLLIDMNRISKHA